MNYWKLLVKDKWQEIISNIQKEYYKDKQIFIFKYSLSLFILFLVLLISFILRSQAIAYKSNNSSQSSSSSGWYQVDFNAGISFGLFRSSTFLVYVLQLIPVLITLSYLLISFDLIMNIPVALVFAGGLSNLVDRMIPDYESTTSHYNTVVDYWWFVNSIINFPDVMITLGVSLIVVVSLYRAYINNVNKNNSDGYDSSDKVQNNSDGYDSSDKVQSSSYNKKQ